MSNIQQYQLLSHPPDRLLKDHLQRVANASMKTVAELLDINKISTTLAHKDLTRTAFIIGATHDTGKGTPYFQEYLLGDVKADVFLKSHAMISALYCSWVILNDKEISEDNRKFLALAASLVIQGHHGSLKSRTKYYENLTYFDEHEIFRKQIESFKMHEQEMETITTHDLKLKSFREFCKSWEEYLFYFSKHIVLLEKLTFQDNMEPFFTINMLYSALLDSDNMDAAELDRPNRLEIDSNIIKSYIGNNLQETTDIDRLRNILFKHVDKQTINLTDNKIITLTAATGLGKTLTATNFALNLREKIKQEKGYTPRIIYVAPFISILDQNMQVLQKALLQEGPENSNLLLMHHHLAPVVYHNDNMKNEGYTTWQSEFLTRGWNAEVVVTTFIQFFNTIFGRFTSHLRRLDNLVGSIVILDEVQSIGHQFWEIVRNVILYFTKKLNFTIIMMTATRPLIFREGETIEIAETNDAIKNIPQRVSFELRNREQITIYDFCDEMNDLIRRNQDKNILIELNTIPTAKECYDSISSDTHDIFFISSQVIPIHRAPRIFKIKQLLENRSSKPILLVSTQVIEAGVDFDFDIAVRDIGPIDSIVQTAGRCNRNGRIKDPADAKFYIYRIVDDRSKNKVNHADHVYGPVSITIANSLLNEANDNMQISDLVNNYYKEIRRRGSNQHSSKISNNIAELNYEEVTNEFRLIDEGVYKLPVFVEYDDNAKEIWQKFVRLVDVIHDREQKSKRKNELIRLRHDMEQYMIDVDEKQILKSGLQVTNNIYKIDFDHINMLYDEMKGFVGLR